MENRRLPYRGDDEWGQSGAVATRVVTSEEDRGRRKAAAGLSCFLASCQMNLWLCSFVSALWHHQAGGGAQLSHESLVTHNPRGWRQRCHHLKHHHFSLILSPSLCLFISLLLLLAFLLRWSGRRRCRSGASHRCLVRKKKKTNNSKIDMVPGGKTHFVCWLRLLSLLMCDTEKMKREHRRRDEGVQPSNSLSSLINRLLKPLGNELWPGLWTCYECILSVGGPCLQQSLDQIYTLPDTAVVCLIYFP